VPQQARADATRRSIIEAAAEMFAATGYANTNLDDIIVRAAISKGALYFHFTSKEGLARAVIDEQHAKAMAGCRNLLDSPLPPLESLISISSQFVAQLLTSPLARAGARLTAEIGETHGMVTDYHQEWLALVAALAERAITTGDMLPGVNSDDFANFLVAAFDGIRFWSIHANGSEDLAARTERLWIFLLPSIVHPSDLGFFREYIHRLWLSQFTHC
jgi:AcrR family transcriptional regulator